MTEKNQKFAENWAVYSIRRKTLFAPVGIIEDKDLSSQSKILFMIINSYAYSKGFCYAGNEELRQKLGLGITMLKQYLKELIDNQLIEVQHPAYYNFKRQIHINFEALKKRYPKNPVKVPASAKISTKAKQKLGLLK